MNSYYIERTEGFTTHYLQWGRQLAGSLPVICIHGNLVNALMYRWIGEHLAAGDWGPARRVIAIDMRGCGNSDMPQTGYTMQHYASDIEAVMQHAGIEKAYFMAFSRGVHYALQFTLEHPARVAGFVAGDYPAQGRALSAEWAENVVSAYMECHTWEELIATLSPDGKLTRQTAETITDVMFREQDGWIRKHYPKELPRLMQRESQDVDLTAALTHIAGPVMIVRGAAHEGSLLSEEQAAVYKQFHSDTAIAEIRGTGHEVFFPNPQTEQTLHEFFAKLR